MSSGMNRLVSQVRNGLTATLCTIALMAFAIVLSATVAQASYAPLQNITLSTSTSNYGGTTAVHALTYSVNDPVRRTVPWQSHSYSRNWTSSILPGWDFSQLSAADGVVAWEASTHNVATAMEDAIMCSTYDLYRGSWQDHEIDYGSNGVSNWSQLGLANKSGVVAWAASYWDTFANAETDVCFTTYDPASGKWRDGQVKLGGSLRSSHWGVTVPLVKDGVVSFVATLLGGWNEMRTYYAVYHPRVSAWNVSYTSQPSLWSNTVAINNATVNWSDGVTFYTRGFNPATSQWYAGATKPLAYVYAAPVRGNAPLTVTFVDMSIGGQYWSWSLGDGGTSASRSPIYTFQKAGLFTTALALSGTGGSSSASVSIVTAMSAPTISVTSPANTTTLSALKSITGTAVASGLNNSIVTVSLTLQRNSDKLFWSGTKWVSGSAVLNSTNGGGWTCTSALPSGSNLPSGLYTLVATVLDAAGNTGATTSQFTIHP